MNIKNRIIPTLVLIGTGLVSSTVMADDYDGLYAGLTGGIGIIKTDGSILTGPIDVVDNSGLISGVIGARYSLGQDSSFVVGLEGSLGYYTSGSDWNYDISGIAGYRVGDSGLIYGRVGYGTLKTDARTFKGLILGGGYEFEMNENMNFRIDYKNISYKGEDFSDSMLNFAGHQITAGVIINF